MDIELEPQGEHLVGGEWWTEPEGGVFVSHSNSDGRVLSEVPVAGPKVVGAAVEAAREAFVSSGWAEREAVARAEVLLDVATWMEERAEELARIVAHEVGMPYKLALRAEVPDALDKLRFYAGAARTLYGDVTAASRTSLLDLTIPRPVGVCALITPWNNPLEQPVRQIGAAFAAGCTIVLKPSERTPLSTEALVRLIASHPKLPPGVVNLVHGPGDPTGEHLVSHRDVAKVSFTGSSATGRRILALAAPSMKRVSIEAGGKSPCLVFDDAPLEKALDALATGAFLYTGQSCSSAAQVIAQAEVYDAVVQGLASRARAMKVGDPFVPDTIIGPAVTRAHAERVAGYFDSLAEEGGRIIVGGTHEGQYVPPTVLVDVPEASRAACEEIFGPVVTVFRADGEEEAIALANRLDVGLQASVWTKDLDRALRIAHRLEAGDVWINTHYIRQAETPYGGWKTSGLGRELGMAGIQEYVRHKRVAIDTLPEYHLTDLFAD